MPTGHSPGGRQMRILTHTITHPSRSDLIRIWPLGDVHLGNAATNEKAFAATVETIAADPLSRWIGMGDYCEWINRGDPRFSPEAAPKWLNLHRLDLARQQLDRFLELTKPIADKCIALVRGNHEDTIARHTERDVYGDIVAGIKAAMEEPPDRLGLGYCGYIRLRVLRGGVESWALDIFAHHGWGGGRLAGSKALKLERAIQRYRADVVLVGHWHTRQIVTGAEIAANRRGTRINQFARVGVCTGHWMDGHAQDVETYVQIAGYPPSTIGCPVIELRPSDKSIRIVV
jgi:hypothetical protein